MSQSQGPEWNTDSNSGSPSTGPAPNRDAQSASVAVWIIAALVTAAHAYRAFTIPAGSWREEEFIVLFGLIPLYVWENPQALITHMGVHGGWLHLAMNVAFFVMLGLVLARRIGAGAGGALKITALTLVSGLGGALAVIAADMKSETAVVGFSGAVCGLAAAFLLSQRLHWRDALGDRRILTSAFWFLALNVGLAWGVSQTGLIGISWEAHLGGFIAGGLGWIVLAPRPVMPAHPSDWVGPWRQ